jgi:hypothetical protein
MRDYSKYLGIFSTSANETFGNLIEEELGKLLESKESSKIIEDYLYLTSKLEEIKYRLNPTYTLSVVNKKDIDKGYILAKVKWPYLFKGRIKSPPYISVHLGSLKKYPKGILEPELLHQAPIKIKAYIDEVAPIQLKKENGEVYIAK